MDERSFKNLQTLHPRVRQDAIQAWTEIQAAMAANVQVIVIQGMRTFEESDKLYAQGRTAAGEIVTKAAAGQSYHNYGLAFDFAMVTNGKDDYQVGPNWLKVVAIMKKHGWQWGGDFPEGQHDYPHFERHFGMNWRQLLQMHNQRDFVAGTTYVNF